MGGVSLETCWASYNYEIKFWYAVASCRISYVNYDARIHELQVVWTCRRQYNWIKSLMEKCALCWFLLHMYVTMHGSKNPNHTSLNENYVVPCVCLRAIWHMHGSMWCATRMTRDRKRIIVAHSVIALWRHYYYALAKFYCRGRVEGNFNGYPSHKTYTCQNVQTFGSV